MSRKKWRFAPTEVKRAIKLVLQAGLPVSEVSIEADGAIRIHTTDGTTTPSQTNPWDEVLPDAAHQERAS
jgi:hypothetical protein